MYLNCLCLSSCMRCIDTSSGFGEKSLWRSNIDCSLFVTLPYKLRTFQKLLTYTGIWERKLFNETSLHFLKYYLLVIAIPQRSLAMIVVFPCLGLHVAYKNKFKQFFFVFKLHWKVVQSFWTYPGSQNSDRKYISKPHEGWYQYNQLTHSDTFNFHTPHLIIDNPLPSCWIPSPATNCARQYWSFS